VTAQGTPLTRFRRAIDSRSVLLAELAAREAGRLPLEDALALLELYARHDDPKLEAATVRWLGRLITEQRPTLADVQLAVAALVSLQERPEQPQPVLRSLLRRTATSAT